MTPGPVEQTADTVLAAAALTTPLWLQILEQDVGVYVLIVGAILLTIRVVMAVIDLRDRLKAKKED